MQRAEAGHFWQLLGGRTAIVLSGGGARGAYEAGVLLAFQDAQLPTHIVTATSVGSINAASYVAHSNTLVGNAEPLIESWSDITPPVVGIEWTRYLWMLAGLIAASAGFGNLLIYLFQVKGIRFNLPSPGPTWFWLGLAGLAVLLLYDYLPYLGYVVRNFFHRSSWKPNLTKALASVAANLIVWGVILKLLVSLHAYSLVADFVRLHPETAALLVSAILLSLALRQQWRAPLSTLLHQLIRVPLGPGLFTNFERGRMLRQRMTSEQLRASPIRVLFTGTDLETGEARYFSNTPAGQLAADPGADVHFVTEEVTATDDLVRAVVASSALPIVYEPVPIGDRRYTDGGIVVNQPIRPAIRLGANVLFLVLMSPAGGRRGDAKTFLDVGLRALDILMAQNLVTDLKILSNINAVVERAAGEHGVRPEEVEIDLGTRRYRYVKAFTIRPSQELGGAVLDFGLATSAPAILLGYRDAAEQLAAFLDYAREARFSPAKRVIRFAAEFDPLPSA
ncbi:MAG: patatin-like phospholipase family protein [Candidatus Acidiferrales bacterium]